MDTGTGKAVVEPVETMFCLEGDNVYFRGLDVERVWNGYECPLFEAWMAGTVARYISTENKQIVYNETARAFVLTKKDDKNKYLLRPYQYQERIYYDFGGTAKWKKIERQKQKNGGNNNGGNFG